MYKLINDQLVLRLEDSVFIPFDERNNDYQKYLNWIEEGNSPLPMDEQGTQA